VPEAVRDALLRAAVRLGPQRGRIGHESGSAFQPASYVSLQLFGADLPQLVREAFPGGTLSAADELLSRLRSVKTAREVDRIRLACRVAGEAFEFGAARLQPGLPETEAAELFQGRLATLGLAHAGVCRSGGSAFCMSGPHSAEAAAAYARSRTRPLERGDLVLMHCNSHVDGYWTDITRTYCLDSADSRQQQMSAAVLAARAAALQALHPGAAAAAADRAARDMISEHGFGDAFKHGTGHGVGFAAIDHHARPRLHPVSSDRLEAGMVFNIEPAIYIPAFGGLRHCDVAAVTATGAEVLTPFQASAEQFILVGREREQNPG
jgi:Xaa-Pro aminopeptidase/Xaa-Pro dipeptidase